MVSSQMIESWFPRWTWRLNHDLYNQWKLEMVDLNIKKKDLAWFEYVFVFNHEQLDFNMNSWY